MSTAIEQLADQIRAHAAVPGAEREPLRIRAGGSKDFYGNTPRGALLDPRAVAGVIAYQPSELVVTARCGTRLAEIEALLDTQGQMLAFEPPHFAPSATVGGCVAVGLAGPRRASAGPAFGAVRDFVLGVTLLDGRGQLLKFGGTVMKNVAGYDVSRLLAGSMGTLGVIVDVSVKVLPKPAAECTLQWPLAAAESLQRLRQWARQPLPVSASAWSDQCLSLRLSGAHAAVEAARKRLGGQRLEDDAAQILWRSLREHTHAFFGGARPLWRLSLPPAAAGLPLDGDQLIEWSGAQRWLRTAAPAADVRACARQLGGHATLFRAGGIGAVVDRGSVDSARESSAPRSGVFTPLSPALLELQRRVRAQFDPHGVFDAGRLYPEL